MPKISILIFLIEIYTHIGQFEYYNSSEILDIIKNLQEGAKSNSEISNSNINTYMSFLNIEGSVNNIIKNLLLLSSLFSFIIGTVVGLAQSKIKRLLAYSTIVRR
jgi:NADH-ubiquinone oxidoreductase chain 2